MEIRIAPSILAADFSRLGEEARAVIAAGADYLHLDVMDGRFVPNITIGQPVVAALGKISSIPLDVHLMIKEPERHLESFAEAGAALITIHVEACRHLHRTLQHIRRLGCRAGVSLNPSTPPESLFWVLDTVDLVLVMSVNPGFGGQSFIPAALDKIALLNQRRMAQQLDFEISVDGGVVTANAGQVAAAGANVLVSGTGIFGQADYAQTISQMRQAAAANFPGGGPQPSYA